MDKSPDAFRTISEVADVLETPAHVLRFWESRFPQLKPVKRAGGRRYYRPSDVALLAGIKRLLHDEGVTIRGVQKILRDQGARHVAGLSDDSVDLADLALDGTDIDDAALHGALYADDPESAGPVKSTPDPLALTEAAFGTFDDPEDDAMPKPALDRQADLPLFAPATSRLAPRPQGRANRREDINLAALIRQAASGVLANGQPELGLLAQRLARLRQRMADRAEGSQG